MPLYTVSGVVSEVNGGLVRAIPSRQVHLWVEQQTGPGSSRASAASTVTDQTGRYTVNVPPDSRVFAAAWRDGELQPCLAIADVWTDTTLDIEVIRESNALSGWRPEDWPSRPIVKGAVYETTPGGGRRPLQGAAIWVDLSEDVYRAFTKTDSAGLFFLCRINVPVRIDVDLPGYGGVSRRLRGGSDTELEIELTRR